jgi:hypothetical protein
MPANVVLIERLQQRMMKFSLYIIVMMTPFAACNDANNSHSASASTTANVTPVAGSFAYDEGFLRKHDSGLITLQQGASRILVSAKYQAKVFTSTADGDSGLSFGWVHYKAFDGPLDPHMNAYGGENRLWLGPEGGPFSLFFEKGSPMTFEHWKAPAAFDSEVWTISGQSDTAVTLTKDMQLTNYAGTPLSINVSRRVRLLDQAQIELWLMIALDTTVKAVAYQTENTLTNTGDKAWTAETGMPCTWILDMFPPSEHTTIIIPYVVGALLPATTNYFGEIATDRIRYKDSVLFLKADGKSRGKLGIHPGRTRPIAGSYDANRRVLTLILFNNDPKGRYLNQEWRTDRPAFSGDAMNAYNDGPLADGSQMGPFYELESVSPSAFLPPGHADLHRHSVFHFTGSEAGLDRICRSTLGVSLDAIKHIF